MAKIKQVESTIDRTRHKRKKTSIGNSNNTKKRYRKSTGR